MTNPKQNVVVLDVGGSHVKLIDSDHRELVKVPSGPKMTPAMMVEAISATITEWKPTAVSIGYPGVVVKNKPIAEPFNMAPGWTEFDFDAAFGCPVRIVNDAAMQALGSYEGGRMLFLGLGTGLGSAMVFDGILAPMELAHLPYRKGLTYEDYVGQRGLDRLGKGKWQRHVERVVDLLRKALEAEYVVLGGGNIRLLGDLPEGVHLGANEKAFLGGFRLWDASASALSPKPEAAKSESHKAEKAAPAAAKPAAVPSKPAATPSKPAARKAPK